MVHPLQFLTTTLVAGCWSVMALGGIGLGDSVAIAAQPTQSSSLDTLRYWQRRTLWRTVQVPEGGFSILMPEQPRFQRAHTRQSHTQQPRSQQSQRQQPYRQRRLKFGQRPPRYDYAQSQYMTAVQQSYGALYMVGWSDEVLSSETSAMSKRSKKRAAEKQQEELESIFNAERELLLTRFGGELLFETPVYLQEHPGQHYQLRSYIGEEEYIITHRSYWVRDRFYQMTVAVPSHRYPGFIGMAEGFMRSFQVD